MSRRYAKLAWACYDSFDDEFVVHIWIAAYVPFKFSERYQKYAVSVMSSEVWIQSTCASLNWKLIIIGGMTQSWNSGRTWKFTIASNSKPAWLDVDKNMWSLRPCWRYGSMAVVVTNRLYVLVWARHITCTKATRRLCLKRSLIMARVYGREIGAKHGVHSGENLKKA